MRLGLLADSHDHLDNLRRAVEELRRREVTQVLHAGDFVAPFTIPIMAELGCPVFGVFGNNDGERVGLARRFESIGEVRERPAEWKLGEHRVLLQHEPVALDALAQTDNYRCVVYGHTHQVDIREGKTLVINPGEVCGWVNGRATCAVVDLATLKVELIDLA